AHVDLLKIKSEQGYWELPQEVHEKIKIITRNADRLALLINNLLDYTRLEAGTVKLKLEEGSLDNQINQLIKEIMPLAKKQGHIIDFTAPKTLPSIYMDLGLINRIFSNLLSNAIKYTPNEGRITVEIFEENNNLHVKVKDTGVGIAKEDLEKIFQPFHITHDPDSFLFQSEFERTGLGLAITKKYVKLHGGTIWAESRIGEGSTFHVTLPKKQNVSN
ncbi:MAG: sensor histidine kinase, partial [Promethearchaeota archaeon]